MYFHAFSNILIANLSQVHIISIIPLWSRILNSLILVNHWLDMTSWTIFDTGNALGSTLAAPIPDSPHNSIKRATTLWTEISTDNVGPILCLLYSKVVWKINCLHYSLLTWWNYTALHKWNTWVTMLNNIKI